MKREELEKLGLTAEQIDKIMAENGKDIEKHKTGAETAKSELEAMKVQLGEANKTIEGFKAMNVDQIKASADDYKAKFEQAQKDATAQLQQLKFDHSLDGALGTAKAKNAKAVKALLDMANLKLNEADGSIVGLDDQLKKIKEANDFLFEGEKADPKIVLGGNASSTPPTDPFMSALRKGAGLTIEKGK